MQYAAAAVVAKKWRCKQRNVHSIDAPPPPTAAAMTLIYRTIKYTGIVSNLIYMLLGIGIIAAAGYGLQTAQPDTAEHTYFIENIVLGSMICMIVIFGFYGLVTDLLAVNIIFTVFICLVLAMHYVQLQGYRPHVYYNGALKRLEHAWGQVQNKSHLMQGIERQYHCCGYYNPHDYINLRLTKPATCYQQLNDALLTDDAGLAVDYAPEATEQMPIGCVIALNRLYQWSHQRDRLFNWCIIGIEIFLLVQTVVYSILIYRRQTERRAQRRLARLTRRLSQGNHLGSRTQLVA